MEASLIKPKFFCEIAGQGAVVISVGINAPVFLHKVLTNVFIFTPAFFYTQNDRKRIVGKILKNKTDFRHVNASLRKPTFCFVK